MSENSIRDIIAQEYNDEALFVDDLDEAIIGVGKQWGGNYVVVYDTTMCIEVLKEKHGWDDIGAAEWFGYNIECAYHGENTPIFVSSVTTLLQH
jgi:hypothetical protein